MTAYPSRIDPLIQVKGLTYYCHSFQEPLFNSLNLKIYDGDFVSLIGPSGSGKTTLLKLIASLLKPYSGTVVIASDRVIGMTFQQSALFDWLDCSKNIEFPLKEKGGYSSRERKAIVCDVLKSVGLSQALGKKVDELSGGMRKRLGVARAIVLRPNILLCDDPTAGLDPITSHSIGKMIKDIATDNRMTVLFVTSRFPEAMKWSDRIVFLSDSGRIIIDGTSEEVAHSDIKEVAEFRSPIHYRSNRKALGNYQ